MKRFVKLLQQTLAEKQPAAMINVVNSSNEQFELAEKMLVFSDGSCSGSLRNFELDKKAIELAKMFLQQKKTATEEIKLSDNSQVEIYIESYLPSPELLIFGADPDAVPVCQHANRLGFKVVLVDHRTGFANKERFPDVTEFVIYNEPSEFRKKLQPKENSYILIKTHNYLRDKEILRFALSTDAFYIGQMGPKARKDDLLQELQSEGFTCNDKQLSRLYAPVGLDISAESPEEIALSVLAEMLAVKNNRSGGFLKDQTGAIHSKRE